MSVISKLVNYTIFQPYGRITEGHLHGEVYLCRLRWKEEEEMRKGISAQRQNLVRPHI